MKTTRRKRNLSIDLCNNSFASSVNSKSKSADNVAFSCAYFLCLKLCCACAFFDLVQIRALVSTVSSDKNSLADKLPRKIIISNLSNVGPDILF